MSKFRLKLIDEWRSAHRFWSVRFNAMAVGFGVLDLLSQLDQLLPTLDGMIPPKLMLVLTIVCLLGSLVARIVQQPAVRSDDA